MPDINSNECNADICILDLLIINLFSYPTLIGVCVCLYLVLSLCGYLFIHTVQFILRAAFENYFSFYTPGYIFFVLNF